MAAIMDSNRAQSVTKLQLCAPISTDTVIMVDKAKQT